MNFPLRKGTYIKFSGILFLLIGTIVIGTALFLPRLIDLNAYRSEIISNLESTLHRKVSFKHAEFSWHLAPAFVFEGVSISEPDGTTRFLTADRILLRLAILPLLEKRVEFTTLRASGAEISLIRNQDGTLNIDDLLKPSQASTPIQVTSIRVSHSSIILRDLAVQKEPLITEARNISLELDHLERGRKGKVAFSCDVPSKTGSPVKMSFSGAVTLPTDQKSLTETMLKVNADIKQLDINHFWPYVGQYIPFGATGGRMDYSTSFVGKIADFSAKGNLRLYGVAVTWPKVFHSPVNPRLAQLEYDLTRTKNSIDLRSIKFNADALKVKGNCKLQDLGTSDPRITAAATTEHFRLEEMRSWIPYGIIAKDAADYIEEHVTGGLFKLESGTLDGRVSQIIHMEKDTNYNVLHIKGIVEKGIISYGSKAPLFNSIKGNLELSGKDFILSGMTGAFGGSTFKMDGRITDYPLDSPCQYPFQMEMIPRPAEIAWLGSFVRAQKLEFSGDSRLVLKGNGRTSAFNLSGTWDLKQAAYLFPAAVRKPSGMSNNITFSALLGPTETKIQSLSYSLPPLQLSASGLFRYGGDPYLGYDIQTNTFMLNENLPVLTGWQHFHPRGKVQVHLSSSGNPEDFIAMSYNGAVVLNSFSFKPDETLKPISGVNGTVTFKGSSVETSSISARYGDSPVTIKGVVKNLKQAEAEITVSSPQLFLKDVKLVPETVDTAIREMQSTFSVVGDRFTIKKLSGSLHDSNFSISGTYNGGRSPEADLEVMSTYLNLDDFAMLISGGDKPASGTRQPATDLKLHLTAETGSYEKIPFSRLNTRLARDSGVLYLQSLDTAIYGGKLSAKGRVAPGGEQGSRYDLTFGLERVNAEQFLQILGISREVTGSIKLSGNITARGKNFPEIRKTALGNVRLELEHGSLRRFNVLSKVFSILNVSQLLKFQLPDMVSNGMPFNGIKGSFAISDGKITTQDLFITSDAINVSVIGKADIVKEELNFTIGVQPLQTVDKIIKRIPVVGWLLTGKDKDFLTVYFEAKGSWANPQVTAIPVKSMSKGVLNIFRRVFELPVRLFTDTGEVLLGQ